MHDQQKIQHYATYMRMYYSMMVDLTASEDFIAKLIQGGDDLSQFERALPAMENEVKAGRLWYPARRTGGALR